MSLVLKEVFDNEFDVYHAGPHIVIYHSLFYHSLSAVTPKIPAPMVENSPRAGEPPQGRGNLQPSQTAEIAKHHVPHVLVQAGKGHTGVYISPQGIHEKIAFGA